jgi:hypothetical protein
VSSSELEFFQLDRSASGDAGGSLRGGEAAELRAGQLIHVLRRAESGNRVRPVPAKLVNTNLSAVVGIASRVSPTDALWMNRLVVALPGICQDLPGLARPTALTEVPFISHTATWPFSLWQAMSALPSL